MSTSLIFALALIVLFVIIAFWITRGRSPTARTVRKAVVKLPVLQSPTVQRLAVTTGLQPKSCGTCEYWNHKAGQEAMQRNPAFMGAAAWLSPMQMGMIKKGKQDEVDPMSVGPAPEITWEDFGACGANSEVTWKQHSCERWM